MISHATDRFWKSFALLPERIQKQAEKAYEQWKTDPSPRACISNASTRQNPSTPSGSASVIAHSAAGMAIVMLWFWIGPHTTYDELIKRL